MIISSTILAKTSRKICQGNENSPKMAVIKAKSRNIILFILVDNRAKIVSNYRL